MPKSVTDSFCFLFDKTNSFSTKTIQIRYNKFNQRGIKMSIYYTRHGKTSWNESHRIQGRVDVPLSIEGKEEANKLANDLKEIPLDLVFSSPLSRALETARIALAGRNVAIIQDKRIIELNYGDFEGFSHDDEKILCKRSCFASRYPNGESYLDAAKRIYLFFDELKEKYPDKNILVVGHLGIARIVNSYFLDMSNDEFIHFQIANCELLKYEFPRK